MQASAKSRAKSRQCKCTFYSINIATVFYVQPGYTNVCKEIGQFFLMYIKHGVTEGAGLMVFILIDSCFKMGAIS